MATTAHPEVTGEQSRPPKGEGLTGSIMSDVRAGFGADGKDRAKQLAGGGVGDKDGPASGALDFDPASRGINIAQKAASRRAGEMASKVGGETGRQVAQDTTKIATEAAKGAAQGAAAGGVGAVPGALMGAAKGAGKTKTGRIVVLVALVSVALYLAAMMLLPLLFMMVTINGGEDEQQRDNVMEVDTSIRDS